MKKIIFAGIAAVVFSCAMGAANAYAFNKEKASASCSCTTCTCDDCSCTDCSNGNCTCDNACCATEQNCGQGCCK